MKVIFYFDPVCPWCWMTSRWVLQVQQERDIEINWQPISLFIKNGPDNEYSKYYEMTIQMLDVIEAVREQGDPALIGDLYTAFGTSIHRDQSILEEDVDIDAIIRNGLKTAGIDEDFAEYAKNEKYRSLVQESTERAIELVGEDVGTPIIALEQTDGSKMGLFGPVMSEIPGSIDDAVELWDAYTTFAKNPHFWELKRTRTEEPNTESTFN